MSLHNLHPYMHKGKKKRKKKAKEETQTKAIYRSIKKIQEQ